MFRVVCIVLLFIFSLGMLFAASVQDRKVIAFAQDTMANDFRVAQVKEVQEAIAKYPNIDFIYSDAKGQTSLLIRQVERFVAMKVDAIILGTNDAEALVPIVTKAHKAGIAVIILDRGINGDDYKTFIHSDNIQIGAIGAEYIAKQIQNKGTVLLFEGLKKADVTQLRSQGFLSEMAKYPEIKVIKRTGNYLRKDAIVEMEKLLKDKIKIDAIFSESDSMLSGVRSALMRYKIDSTSLITVGCDYTSEAQEAIRKGTQTASVLFPLGGTEAVDIAVKIFANEKVPKDFLIPVLLVTRDNSEKIKPIF